METLVPLKLSRLVGKQPSHQNHQIYGAGCLL